MTAGLVLSFQIGHDPEKKKLVKSDLIKFLTFYPVKDAVKKMEKKKKVTDWEKIFAQYMKDSYPKQTKKHLKLKNEMSNKPIKKQRKDPERPVTREGGGGR